MVKVGETVIPRDVAQEYLDAAELAERRYRDGTLGHSRSDGERRRLRVARWREANGSEAHSTEEEP